MAELPTTDELLRRKAIELDELDRPRRRAEETEQHLVAARAQYWKLLEEFVDRARQLGVEPVTWTPPARSPHAPRIMWIEGYPLANDSVVSAPPLRYCKAERRRVRRPVPEIVPITELCLFVPRVESRPGTSGVLFDQQTVSGGTWPEIVRLEHASSILTALERRLETSLLALMD